ncbi:MAG: DUF5763 domain-containing protein [Bradymonadaceae bacterium]
MSDQCQATTDYGDQCKNPAGEDGYCHVESHGSQSDGDDTQARDPQYDPELVAQAIRGADGNLTEAAERVGCHRFTVHRYCNDFEVCRKARDDARNSLVDRARSTLDEKLTSQDEMVSLKAAKFIAKHYDDGAAEKQKHEHTGEGGGPLEVTINDSVVSPDGGEG